MVSEMGLFHGSHSVHSSHNLTNSGLFLSYPMTLMSSNVHIKGVLNCRC
jgi:hypothetical protein